MKQIIFWTVLALSVGICSCSSDDNLLTPLLPEERQPPEQPQVQEEPPQLPPEPEAEAWVYGRLMDAGSGQPVKVSVHISAGESTAFMQGEFFFIQLPVGREHLLVLEPPASEYPRTSHRVMAQAGVSTYVEIWMLPFEKEAEFDASVGGSVTASGAEVIFPPDSLNATGKVTARLARLNAAEPNHLSSFPGGFRTDEGGLLESFGAIAVEVRDADGKLVNLHNGKHAQAKIPVSNVRDDEIPLWVYDEDAGLWKQEGEPLTGCKSGTCSGELPHLSWWNADVVMQTTCLTVCVADTNGHPSAGVYVEARGVDYFGITVAYSGADGCACLPVRTESEVNVAAIASSGNSAVAHGVSTSDTLLVCGGACPQVSLTVAPPKFQAILTSGGLHAQLSGPCPDCVEGKFHVSRCNWGSLSGPPFAAWHYEGMSEMVVLSACAEGSYRYSALLDGFLVVLPDETQSASTTLLLPDGSLLSYSTDAASSALPLWTVGELQCNASCECTWVPIDSLGTSDMPICREPTYT